MHWQAPQKQSLLSKLTPSKAQAASWGSLALVVSVVWGATQGLAWWQGRQAAQAMQDQPGAIVMYTTTTCPYCKAAREWLNSNQVVWRECNVDIEATCREEFQSKGAPGVPLLKVNDDWRLGFDPNWVLAVLKR
jgi:glutaredoxin